MSMENHNGGIAQVLCFPFCQPPSLTAASIPCSFARRVEGEPWSNTKVNLVRMVDGEVDAFIWDNGSESLEVCKEK